MTQALRVIRAQRSLISPEAAIRAATRAAEIEQAPRRTSCNFNCYQGKRCTCTGAPMPDLSPRAARTYPTALEQRASDFGALDLRHQEDPEPSAADIDEQLRPRDARMARLYRWGWRACFAAAALLWITGCDGADTHLQQQQFEPALRPPQDTPQPSSKPHRAQRTNT